MAVQGRWLYDAFTSTNTETDTSTETDKTPTVPNDIGVSVQYEHLHTILYNPFFIGLSNWSRSVLV